MLATPAVSQADQGRQRAAGHPAPTVVAGVSPATHLRRRDREAAWPPAEARSSEERGAPVRCAAPAQCYCARSVTVRRYCTCRSTLLPAGPAWSTARGLRAADQRGLAVRRRDWQAAQRRSCESLDLPNQAPDLIITHGKYRSTVNSKQYVACS